MNWSCKVFGLLLMRTWEGEVFLYNPLTAHTHILNELGWQVLCACSKAPVPQDRLLDLLNESAGFEATIDASAENLDREKLAEVLNNHLDQLSRLGLLEGTETLAA
jgi:PqqD family protein of HPr-rel-A system